MFLIYLVLFKSSDYIQEAHPLQYNYKAFPFLDNEYWLWHTVFSTSNNCAISINTDRNITLLVERCSFINISSVNEAGAIMFVSQGNFCMKTCCSYYCYANSGMYHFIYSVVPSTSSQDIFCSTVSRCPHKSISGSYCIYLSAGFSRISNWNLSYNASPSTSYGFSIIARVTLNLNFSTIYGNDMSQNLFYLSGNSNSDFQIKFSNFISNTCVSNSYYLLCLDYSNYVIERNIFGKNRGYLFYVPGQRIVYLANVVCHYYGSGSIGNSYPFTYYSEVNGIVTGTHALEHIHTINCNAQMEYNEPTNNNVTFLPPPTPPRSLYPPPTDCMMMTSSLYSELTMGQIYPVLVGSYILL